MAQGWVKRMEARKGTIPFGQKSARRRQRMVRDATRGTTEGLSPCVTKRTYVGQGKPQAVPQKGGGGGERLAPYHLRTATGEKDRGRQRGTKKDGGPETWRPSTGNSWVFSKKQKDYSVKKGKGKKKKSPGRANPSEGPFKMGGGERGGNLSRTQRPGGSLHKNKKKVGLSHRGRSGKR